MRKIVIFLWAIMMLPVGVKAEDVVNWQEKDENMQDDAIVENRYRFYKEEKEGEYLQNFDELESKYQYKDSNDIKYLEYGSWQSTCDVDSNIFMVEDKQLDSYQKVLPTRFMILSDFSKDSKIKNIYIYNDDELVDYQFLSCPNCVDNLLDIDKNKILKIYYDKFIEVDSLKVEIEFEDSDIEYLLTFSNDANMNKISLQKEVSSNDIEFIFDKSWLDNSTYGEIFYEVVPIEVNDFIKYLGKISMCRYRKYLVYNYNLNKVYYDNNYYTDVDGYIKDENDYKIYYKNKEKEEDSEVIFTKNSIEDEIEEQNKIEVVKEENTKEANIKKEVKKSNKIEDKVDNKLMPTLSISNNKSIVKYVILIVIGLTLIYIIYCNRKTVIKK